MPPEGPTGCRGAGMTKASGSLAPHPRRGRSSGPGRGSAGEWARVGARRGARGVSVHTRLGRGARAGGGRLSRSACGRRSVRDVSGRLSVQKFRGLKLPQAISTRKPHPWLWEGVGAKVLLAGPPRLQAPGSWLLARWPPGTVMRDHTTSKEQQMRVRGFQNQVKGEREV